MKLLIIGSCRNNDFEHKFEAHKKLVEKIGEQLALNNHEIITGGAGGLQGYLVTSYKKHGGKKWSVYYAIDEEKDLNAKPIENITPDEEIFTKFNYAMRDVFYIEKADAVVSLSGKILTFSEIIQSVKSYNKKVFQLEIGKNLNFIKKCDELKENVFISLDINDGLKFLEK
jgi:predicted Rossmann-fold nucleotide-binding protein